MQLSYTSLWVHDQEEALAFYRDKLGFEVREDISLPELGGYRWLTIGPPGQDLGFALNTPGPPFPQDQVDGLTGLMKEGLLSGLFFNSDDCRATVEELKGRGVQFEQEPTEVPYGIEAVFRDPSGNSLRVVQRS